MLVRKQMSWYVSNKYVGKWGDTQAIETCSMSEVRSSYDKLHFDDILLSWSNAYQQTLQKIY